MNEQEFRELSAAAALHALTADELQAFATARALHPEWEASVERDVATAAELGEGVREVQPPAALRAGLLAQIAELPQQSVTEPVQLRKQPSAPKRASRRAAWFALAAAAATVLALSLSPVIRDGLVPRDPVTIAMERLDTASDTREETVSFDDSGRASLRWSDEAQEAVLVAEGLPELAAEQDFELWIVRDGAPISLGVMPVEQRGASMLAAGFEPGDAIAVTVEQQGGSPTGQPTTEPILVVASA